MQNDNYFEQREINTIEKLKLVRRELPLICNDFFIGIESYTSPLTRLGYAIDLKIFFEFLSNEYEEFNKPIRSISYSDLSIIDAYHIENFLSYLSYYKIKDKTYRNTNKTKARKLSSLKSYFKYCYNKDKIPRDPAAKVHSIKINEKQIIRFDRNEMIEFLENVESGYGLQGHAAALHDGLKERDLAIMTLFLGTGIRISELVGLNIDDFDFNNNAFKVTRKGGNQTILYFNDEVKEALFAYLDVRSKKPELDNVPALFVSLKNTRISVRAVQTLVKKYSEITTPLKHITPHKLRTTFGTNLYTETKDIYIVAEVLGHKDVNTTKKHYAAISENIKKDAVNYINLKDKNNN